MPQATRQRVLFLTVLVTATGCAILSPPKATVDVTDVEAAFPTIERLAAVVYMRDEENEGAACEYFQYGRGAFTSRPDDEFCRVFDFDDRQPGGGIDGPVPIRFDDQGTADLAALKDALNGVGSPLDYLNLVLAPDGSVGADSRFNFDGCVLYTYEPRWTRLPEDIEGETVTTGINENWHKTDDCP